MTNEMSSFMNILNLIKKDFLISLFKIKFEFHFELYLIKKSGVIMRFFLFLVTVPNIEEAQRIAKILVEERLAACVNIISNIMSWYRWKDKVENAEELLLMIKTSEAKSDLIIKKINEIHSYEVPECIGFLIDKGSESYLDWIKENTF